MKLSFFEAVYFLKKILVPKVPVAGLELKDAAVRLIQFDDGNLRKAAVMLEPGIIDNGKIKDRNKLASMLKKLHDQMGTKEKIPVIAIIPSTNVYTKAFSTPILDQKSLEEAAMLNLKSISPINLDKSYADWQEVGTKERNGKIDILGAFADGAVVDEYAAVLRETDFLPAAVEFPALALARTVKEFGSGIDLEKPQVVINIASDGIDFMVIRGGDLHFDYFVPWKLAQEGGQAAREILFEDFKSVIVSEVKKMANFYGSHWSVKLNSLILISQALNKEIIDLIQNNFQFQIIDLRLNKYADLQASWFPVLGSMVRGLVPREKDVFISLMAVGTETLSLQAEVRSFIRIWRNIFITALGFITLLFLLVGSFLAQMSVNLTDQLQKITQVPGGEKIVALESQAKSFNQLVEKASLAKQQSGALFPFFADFDATLNNKLKLTRIVVDAAQSSVLVIGEAGDEATAVDFKNALIKKGFQNVSLPLSNLVAKSGGGVAFSVSFKLAK